jgi:MarR family transcriptional regulator, 2-MHQ and catechol-resistance regulon repressor
VASIDERLISALGSAMRSLERPLSKHIAAADLTLGQFAVLEMILHKGPRTVNEIIAGLLSSSGNIGVVIDNLLSAGLLEKKVNPADGRSRIISLTASGDKKIRAYYPQHKEELHRLMSGMEHSNKKELIKALALLRRCIDDNSS